MNSNSISGLVMAGCILIGVAVGNLLDMQDVFVPLGVGAGLISMALIRSQNNNRNRDNHYQDPNDGNY